MSNVVYIAQYLDKRDCSPASTMTLSDDLQLMARHIRTNAGSSRYPLCLDALACELERMSERLQE
jgi:hypothetical protein